ncbi:MAG: hypothetical protein CL526_01030 [Aequorivita sp.]|nr:hypothetical protein [Aequorivita sp.]|tara:strand:- start:74675 stop:75802 length:1128 start_codon:yes stop_codon:yes gene_type:complete
MATKKLYLKTVLFVAVLLLSASVGAQSKIDSILKITIQQIYDNPDRVINLGTKLLDEDDITADNMVRVILTISTAYSSKRDYKKSIEYTLDALKLLPKLTDSYLKINLLNRIGGQYEELKIYDKSITYLNQANELIEKMPKDEEIYRSLGYNNLVRGLIYREQMSCDTALKYFEMAINDYKKIIDHPAAQVNISTSYYNRGNCLITLGRFSQAEKSFLQAVNFAQQIDAKSLIAFAQKGLAEVYTAQSEYNKSIAILEAALQNSEDVGDKILNRALYNALATNYAATGNFQKYSFYKRKNQEIHNEVTMVERQTVDNSIIDNITTNTAKISKAKNTTKLLQIILFPLILLGVIFIIRTIITSEKTLKSLKKRLQS